MFAKTHQTEVADRVKRYFPPDILGFVPRNMVSSAAMGSAAGGLLYDVTWLPNAAFVLTAAVVGLAVWPSLWLPEWLMPRRAKDH